MKKIGTTFCCGNFASLKLERCFAEGKWGRWLAPAEQSSKRPFRSSREGLLLRARAPMTKKSGDFKLLECYFLRSIVFDNIFKLKTIKKGHFWL